MPLEPLGIEDTLAGPPATITITIGADGRLLFHDLTAQSLPVAAALCPDDAELRQRLETYEAFEKGNHGDNSKR